MKRRLCFVLILLLFVCGFSMHKASAATADSYVLQVNRGTNVVTVFQSNGTPYKAFVCSTGWATPSGTFHTSQKLQWHELAGPSYGQYCTRITGGILFHSVWYYRRWDYASQSYEQYNKLGTTASHGCVRLTVADAKWIYENCPLGTTVNIINGSAANDPLGKPAAIKVNAALGTGWDPTDPAAGNPYASLVPSINASAKGTELSYSSGFDYTAGISAADSLGNDITPSITYTGSVDTKTLGTYTVTYFVTDALGRSAQQSIAYRVVDTQKAAMTGVKSKLTKEYKRTYKLFSGIRAKTVDNKVLTSKIRVKIIYPGSKKEKTYAKKTICLTKIGTYKINYYVTNPNNQLVTKKVTSIKVQDTKKPILSGVGASKNAEYNAKTNLKTGVTSRLVSGKSMTGKIVIKVRTPGSKTYKTLKASGSETVNYKKYQWKKIGTYYVQYSVTNPNNKKAVTKKTLKVVVKDTKKPVLTTELASAYEYGQTVNLKKAATAVLLSKKDVTESIIISIRLPGSSTYETLKTSGNGSENASSYQFNMVGAYYVSYSVANPNKKTSVASKALKILVTDTQAPTISGVENEMVKTAECSSACDLYDGLSVRIPSQSLDIHNPECFTISVTAPDETAKTGDFSEFLLEQIGRYTIVYTAVNPVSKKSTSVVVYIDVTAAEDAEEDTEEVTEGSTEGNTEESTEGNTEESIGVSTEENVEESIGVSTEKSTENLLPDANRAETESEKEN